MPSTPPDLTATLTTTTFDLTRPPLEAPALVLALTGAPTKTLTHDLPHRTPHLRHHRRQHRHHQHHHDDSTLALTTVVPERPRRQRADRVMEILLVSRLLALVLAVDEAKQKLVRALRAQPTGRALTFSQLSVASV